MAGGEVLSKRAPNRALLARQLLLERSPLEAERLAAFSAGEEQTTRVEEVG